MAEAPSSRDLRKEFPDMPFDGFLEIIKIFGDEDPEALRELLREQNEQARLMEEERQRTLRQRFEQITASMLHRKGVLIEPKSGTRGSEAYSLNINERAKGVTAEGREIIAAVKRFLHEHLPTRRK